MICILQRVGEIKTSFSDGQISPSVVIENVVNKSTKLQCFVLESKRSSDWIFTVPLIREVQAYWSEKPKTFSSSGVMKCKGHLHHDKLVCFSNSSVIVSHMVLKVITRINNLYLWEIMPLSMSLCCWKMSRVPLSTKFCLCRMLLVTYSECCYCHIQNATSVQNRMSVVTARNTIGS